MPVRGFMGTTPATVGLEPVSPTVVFCEDVGATADGVWVATGADVVWVDDVGFVGAGANEGAIIEVGVAEEGSVTVVVGAVVGCV